MTDSSAPQLAAGQVLVLHDGDCAFCLGWVRRLAAWDRHDRLRFLALGSNRGRALAKRHSGLDPDHPSTVVAVRHFESPDEFVQLKSSAIIEVARVLGWPYKMAVLLRAVPRSWRDWGYDLIARHRHQLSGAETCVLADPELKRRLWT